MPPTHHLLPQNVTRLSCHTEKKQVPAAKASSCPLARCGAMRSRHGLGQDGLILAHGPVEAEEAGAQPGGVIADTCVDVRWFAQENVRKTRGDI